MSQHDRNVHFLRYMSNDITEPELLDSLRSIILGPLSPTDVGALMHLFAILGRTVPDGYARRMGAPSLHCVRCHRQYYAINNVPQSCVLPDATPPNVDPTGYSLGGRSGEWNSAESHTLYRQHVQYDGKTFRTCEELECARTLAAAHLLAQVKSMR